mgnify:FL=1
MTEEMVRVSFTVPPEPRSEREYLSARLGVTKSALVTELLGTPLRDLRSLVEMVPDNPTQDEMLRARGASNDMIAGRLRSYRKLEGDLFDDRDR